MVSSYQMNGDDFLKVDNSPITFLWINAIKEQQVKIESLRKQQEEIIKELDILRNSMP